MSKEKSVKIYAMTHKKFEEPTDKMYVPLQVGRAIHEDLGYLGDDTGDNISEKNPFYAELTGMYWVWKNCKDVEYVGICHYRRFLINEQEKVLTKKEILDILETKAQVIVTKKLELKSNYYDGFAQNHNIRDLEAAGKVIKEKYSDYYPNYEKMVHKNETYFGNIMICSKKIYDSYCEWLFDIFFEVEKYVDFSDYDDYHMRVYGFISEFLLMVWLETNGYTVYECKVGMLGEKAETRELKNKLGEYFLKKDIQGAKKYFLEIQRNRPDVLMEASDITGELKMSMQVISTSEFETSVFGRSFIEDINDFRELMNFFGEINNVINRYRLKTNTEKDEVFIKETKASYVALRISAMLYCTSEDSLKETLKKIAEIAKKTGRYDIYKGLKDSENGE